LPEEYTNHSVYRQPQNFQPIHLQQEIAMDLPDHFPSADQAAMTNHATSTTMSRGCFYTEFPVEVDLHVGYAAGNDEDPSAAVETLHALSLTSRDFHALFNPLLYKAGLRKFQAYMEANSQTDHGVFARRGPESAMDWALARRQQRTKTRAWHVQSQAFRESNDNPYA
jgi:hypothetical protein